MSEQPRPRPRTVEEVAAIVEAANAKYRDPDQLKQQYGHGAGILAAVRAAEEQQTHRTINIRHVIEATPRPPPPRECQCRAYAPIEDVER